MLAVMGMLFQNDTFCTTGPEMLLPGAAFENETRVQVLVGFLTPGLLQDRKSGV
jgi:hypothetical protein